MRNNLMKRGASFVSGLCLALTLLFAAAVQAEELKSFLTLKVADPGTLMSVGEKIADLAGQRRDFDAGVASFKDLSGLNKKGPFGLVLQSDGEEIKNPAIILPIEKLEDVNLPNFDALMASAKKESDEKYVLNSPMGAFSMYQKKGYVLIVPADSETDLPEDVSKLFAGLDDYTFAVRLDMENTSLDSIEMLLAPVMMIMAMQGGQAAETAENLGEAVETLYKECRSITFGASFDPKTAATEFVMSTIPKKDSDTAKQMAGYNSLKTAFSGFLGGGSNVIFSFGGVGTSTETSVQTAMTNFEPVFEGILEQVEMQAETDEDYELAEKAVESLRKILEATLKLEKSDFACSLDADATFLAAMTLGDTAELKKLAKLVFENLKGRFGVGEVDAAVEKYVKKEYQTIAGYKVSSFVFPLADAEDADIPPTLADKTVAVYWGVKENEAVTVAFGFDAQATEKRFTEALNKTASPVVVKRPEGMFSFEPLGKLLEKYVPDDARDETMKKVLDLLTATSGNAKITIASKVAGEAMEVRFAATGDAIQTIANLIRIVAAAEATDDSDDATIRSF